MHIKPKAQESPN